MRVEGFHAGVCQLPFYSLKRQPINQIFGLIKAASFSIFCFAIFRSKYVLHHPCFSDCITAFFMGTTTAACKAILKKHFPYVKHFFWLTFSSRGNVCKMILKTEFKTFRKRQIYVCVCVCVFVRAYTHLSACACVCALECTCTYV